MGKAQIIQHQARRILSQSNRNCLFRRSYETLPAANQTLPSRIKTDINQKASIIPLLEQWRKQGYEVKHSVFDNFPEDCAAQLHLVNTVLGLEEAEKMFKNIPEKMRDYSVLLSSYTKPVRTVDKAEATFKKMRELGFLLKPYLFKSMICLYGQLQRLDMVEKLLYKLKKNNMEVGSLKVNNVSRVYANINAMEKFKTWVTKEGIELERDTIVAMAKAYHKAGSIEKAIEVHGDKAGSKTEVYHLWNLYKKKWKLKDDGYRSVINYLLKLDDVRQGA
ncbi:putative tetratricopeptide-like helical domain superfamily [Arabidopsis thaliana]